MCSPTAIRSRSVLPHVQLNILGFRGIGDFSSFEY